MPGMRAFIVVAVLAAGTAARAEGVELSGAAAIADAVLWGREMPASALTPDLPRNVQAQVVEVKPKGKWPLLLAVPDAPLLTEQARRVLPFQYSRADAVTRRVSASLSIVRVTSARGRWNRFTYTVGRSATSRPSCRLSRT